LRLVGRFLFDKEMHVTYNVLNKGAGRIACTYPLRRYVLSYKVTVQPLAGEWTVIFALGITHKRYDRTKHDDEIKQVGICNHSLSPFRKVSERMARTVYQFPY